VSPFLSQQQTLSILKYLVEEERKRKERERWKGKEWKNRFHYSPSLCTSECPSSADEKEKEGKKDGRDKTES